MKKYAIFDDALTKVADITDISKESILSKTRTEEIVYARLLIILYCHKKGLHIAQIAPMLGKSIQGAYQSLYKAMDRYSYDDIFKADFDYILK